MSNRTDKYRCSRWFASPSVPVLFISLLLVACGDNTANREENRTGTNLDSLTKGDNAATELTTRVECSDLERFKSVAYLSWRPAEIMGSEQRIDVTIFKDGFDTGRFESSKTIPPDESSYLLEDVKGQALHRWRVVTLNGNDASVSKIVRFEGVVCVGDVIVDTPPIPVL